MKWIIINDEYLDYMRKNIEPRIPNTNYGINKFKPFFGILFEKDDLYYVTQISSPKPRHFKMKESIDFHKIYDFKNNSKLLGVVNLNYMFPVPKGEINDVLYSKMDEYRNFNNASERSAYILLLRKELQTINNLNLDLDAKNLYQLKINYPNNLVSQRCFDFINLEKEAVRWMKEKR